eukprot:882118-Alexandrium_andersonii.AAC.1
MALAWMLSSSTPGILGMWKAVHTSVAKTLWERTAEELVASHSLHVDYGSPPNEPSLCHDVHASARSRGAGTTSNRHCKG